MADDSIAQSGKAEEFDLDEEIELVEDDKPASLVSKPHRTILWGSM